MSKDKDLIEICDHAELHRLRRGDAILCSKGYGTDTPFPIPLLCKGDTCVATIFFSTSHTNPDCCYKKEKMYTCPHRKPKN